MTVEILTGQNLKITLRRFLKFISKGKNEIKIKVIKVTCRNAAGFQQDVDKPGNRNRMKIAHVQKEKQNEKEISTGSGKPSEMLFEKADQRLISLMI